MHTLAPQFMHTHTTMPALSFASDSCRGGGQWNVGKAFDTFAPIGPAIVTPDDELMSSLSNLDISCTLNGNAKLSVLLMLSLCYRKSGSTQQHKADGLLTC